MTSSSSATCLGRYDVFLSFRGKDTRKSIVSHLYSALCRYGISTFKDDRTIEKGDSFPDELIKAIRTSPFAIVVISENYATSTWCLDELRMIMERQAAKGDTINVVPIFYKVAPSDIREQRGSFATAFAGMGRPEMDDNVQKWREALELVASIQGFDSKICVDEATMVEDVAKNISDRLFTMHTTDNAEDTVGMTTHMEVLGSLLDMESQEEVRFVGIWGMGGIGKTTIAKSLYSRFSRQFSDAHCFLPDVKKVFREQGLSQLQVMFLSEILGTKDIKLGSMGAGIQGMKGRLKHRKVFVVLDDVDKVEQLHGLAKDPSWFGPGSRIIITTRDKGLLDTCGVKTVYAVKCLDQEDALQMFKHTVFGGGPNPNGFDKRLISRASRLAHGLPGAIKYYSSYLQTKMTEEWEKEVLNFEEAPHEKILDIVKSSYQGLAARDKIAFLYVACLFNRYHFLRASTLLDDGESRIKNLVEQSLIDISAQGCINMHFLVEQTGREIVLEESNHVSQRQRILWDPVDVHDVLHHNTGTESIEGLALHMCDMPERLSFEGNGFKPMHNVKFLKFYTHLDDIGSNLQLLPEAALLPRMLKLLHWDSYPLTTLPSEIFPRGLVELTLRYSKLTILDRNLNLNKLKRLDVTGSQDLTEIPDLSRATQLKELIVEGCKRLKQILMSTRSRYTLRTVDLSNCDDLQSLPAFISIWISHATEPIFFRCQGTRLKFEITALKPFANLSIEGDIKIKLQELVGDVENLSYISEQQQTTSASRLRQRSDRPNIGILLDIKRFNYSKAGVPFRFFSLSAFSCLVELKLINLNIHRVPDDIDLLHSLEKLDLTGNDFEYLPTALGKLEKLNYVILCHCRKLQKLPNLTQLQTLKLSGCTNLQSLMVSDGGRYRLLELDLDNCRNVQSLSQQLCHFTELMLLDLSTHEFQTIPKSITEILQLGTLCLNNCKELKSLGELPPSLNYLNAHSCISLETVSLPYKHSIKHLDLSDCSRLNQGEEVITQFLSGGKHEEVSLRFACIPGTEVPRYFDNQPTGKSIRLSSKLLGFAACIMVACERPFHLQFPTSSYSWNWEAGGVFRINLRPNIYRLSGTEKQKAVAKDYLVIIKVLSNKNNDEGSNIHIKPELQFSQEFPSPPVEIKEHRVHMIHKTA